MKVRVRRPWYGPNGPTPLPKGKMAADTRRAAELYTRLWGESPEPPGTQRRKLTAELMYLVNIMEPKERAHYYRHVGIVVRSIDRRSM